MKKHYEHPDKIEKLEAKVFKIPEARIGAKSEMSRYTTRTTNSNTNTNSK